MKKITLVTLALLGTLTITSAQNKIPAEAKAGFSKKFPGIKKVKWYKESANLYEASFVLKGIACSADFSGSGEWLETETPSTFKKLPLKVRNAFAAEHKGIKAHDVSSIKTPNRGDLYEIEIMVNKKLVEFIYNPEGMITKE